MVKKIFNKMLDLFFDRQIEKAILGYLNFTMRLNNPLGFGKLR